MDDLSGEWVHRGSYYTITALKDFEYTDIYSNAWEGTVTVNGDTLKDCSYTYIDYFSTTFIINPQIRISPRWLNYRKGTYYDVDISFGDIEKGRVVSDITIVHEGVPVNIKIDLTAPQIKIKKGEQFNIPDKQYSGDYLWINYLNFISPRKISGDASTGDMISRFNGTWSVRSGLMRLTYKEDLFNETETRIFKYKKGNGKLLLYNSLDYSKNHIYGSIPKENIKDIIYYNNFERHTDLPI